MVLTVHEDSDHISQALQAGAGGSPMMTNIARKVVKAFHQVAPPKPAIATLSARENEVLQLLAQGYLYKEIADTLNVAVPTVNTYIRRIYEKLHVRSRSEAIARLGHTPIKGDLPNIARRGQRFTPHS